MATRCINISIRIMCFINIRKEWNADKHRLIQKNGTLMKLIKGNADERGLIQKNGTLMKLIKGNADERGLIQKNGTLMTQMKLINADKERNNN